MKTKLRRTSLSIAFCMTFAVLVGSLLAGCGGSSSTTGGTNSGSDDGGSSSAESTTASAGSGDAAAFAAKWYKGTFVEPKLTPLQIPGGKDVWVVSVGQVAVSAQQVVNVFTEYGQQVGWQVHVFDGKFEPNRWLEGVRSAIASRAEIIAIYAIDCSSIAAALKEAKAAEIPVINIQGQDCDAEGGEQLFTYSVPYAGNLQVAEYSETIGEGGAGWVAEEEPAAKILTMDETDLVVTSKIAEGFEKGIEENCPECELSETLEFVGTEVGPTLQEKVEQTLQRNPDITVIHGNYDDIVLGSLIPAVRNLGLQGQIRLIGAEGQKELINQIRAGTVAAATGLGNQWEGYALMDATARVLAGSEPTEDSGIGVQLIDKEHNLPAEGQLFEPPVDYKGAYLKAWGLG